MGYVRGGRLKHLAELELRGLTLILVSLVIQLLIFPLGEHGAVITYGTRYLHLLSYLPLLAFIWLNRRFWEILLMGLGILLNFLVILINGGYMPAPRRH